METNKGDLKNLQLLETQALLQAGEYEQALGVALDFVNKKSKHVLWYRFAAEALTGLGRPQEALDVLRDALERHQGDPRLLRTARAIASQHGYWTAALDYTEQLMAQLPEKEKLLKIKLYTLLAMGRNDEVKLFGATNPSLPPGLQKAINFEAWTDDLRKSTAPFVDSWEVAHGIKTAPILKAPENTFPPVTVIQYWSQGEVPHDLMIVCRKWDQLARKLGLGPVNRYDKESAGAWIARHAPEYLRAFQSAFHYAMESDIFRIAYASKKPCLYVDTDVWPLPQAADIISAAMSHGSTLLYLRAYRPWVLNGLFLSYPNCAFVRRLVATTENLNFDEMPQNHTTIDATFGPSRFNEVVKWLIKGSSDASVFQADGVDGLSILRMNKSSLFFSHEAAIASVTPLFALGYKTTEANWKKLGGIP